MCAQLDVAGKENFGDTQHHKTKNQSKLENICKENSPRDNLFNYDGNLRQLRHMHSAVWWNWIRDEKNTFSGDEREVKK